VVAVGVGCSKPVGADGDEADEEAGQYHDTSSHHGELTYRG